MIYRRVIDVTEASLFNDQNGNWSRLFPSGFFPEGKKNDISLEENEITTSVPSHLLYYGEINDSLDVFKRVRLFTRWQDAEESRAGRLFFKFGNVSLWWVSGPAIEVCAQMMQNLKSEAFGDMSNIRVKQYRPCKEREKLRDADSEFFFAGFYFLGTSRRKARPVFILYSKYKYVRHGVLGSMRGLEWFDPNKSGVVATTWCNPVIRQQIIEECAGYPGWDRGFAEEIF
jgi:hypothetical protein